MRRNLWISLAVAALVFMGLGALFLAGGTALAGWPDAESHPALASLPGGASPTPTLCPTGNYGIAQSTGATVVPGTTDIGNSCDDCVTSVTLPFAYTLYDQTFSSANVSSNGNVQFTSSNDAWGNNCLPDTNFDAAIFAYWDDLTTVDSGDGVFTSVSGTAPNRIFNIEWRAHYLDGNGSLNFEVRLYEGQAHFDVIYGTVPERGASATIGVQRDTGSFSTQFACNRVNAVSSGLQLSFGFTCVPPSPTATPTPTNTPVPVVCGGAGWDQAGGYPDPVADEALAAQGGRLYSFGGNDTYSPYTTAYRFDPAANTWTALADMPVPLSGSSAVSDGTYVYIVNGSAGFDGGGTPTAGKPARDKPEGLPPTTLMRYDPVAGTYTGLDAPPTESQNQAAVYLNGQIYRIGGQDFSGPLSSVDVYTLSTDTWAAVGTVADLPQPLARLAAVAYNGYIWVAGGIDGTADTTKTYRYDPATNTWNDAAIADLPQTRSGAASDILNGRWILAGGDANGSVDGSVVALDMSNPTAAWVALPAMPLPRTALAGATIGNSFYAVAGLDNTFFPTQENQRYTEVPACTATPSPTTTRTSTPTLTRTPTGTSTPTRTSTSTPSNTPTRTSTPSNTATPTNTPTNTNTPTGTITPVNTATPTNTPSNTATPSTVPSNTATTAPTATFTGVPVSTGTPTVASTATHTVVPSSTATVAVNTSTPTPVSTSTATPPGPPASSTPLPSRTPAATGTATPTGTWTPPPRPQPLPLAGGPGDQTDVHIDGNVVVWEDNASGTWDVYAKDLVSGVRIAIATGPGDQRNPDVSGNLVVWQDNTGGPWAIYGRYLTGDVPGPVFLIAGGPTDQTNPAVSGHEVVWQRADATPTTTATAPERPDGVGRWSIVYGDLDSSQVRTLTTGSTTNINPAIDGNFVVWQSIVPTDTLRSPSGVGRWTLDGFDIGASRTFAVTNAPGDQTNPAISGTTVVWQTYQSAADSPDGVGRWTVEGSEVDGSGAFVVTTSTHGQQYPDIDGRLVVVQDQAPGTGDAIEGVGRWSIIAVDLDSGNNYTVSNDPGDATHPAVSGGTIVWSQTGEDGTQDVYGNLCLPSYQDVQPVEYFSDAVGYLSCRSVLSGYADGTFRPYQDATRGQVAKIMVLAKAWTLNTSGGPHFSDVPADHPFYRYIETAYHHGIISGYNDGTFRPYSPATRSQFSKIVVAAEGWAPDTSGGPHFSDVRPGNPFYAAVETAYHKGVVSGYADGTFHPYINITRGQIAKMVHNALFAP